MRRLAAALFAAAALAASSSAQEVPQSREQIALSFAPVVKQVAPAVVNVYARRMVRNPFADDPIYRQFFPDAGDQEQRSLGSGVIARADGTVITNNHVIEGADELIVVLADRREFPASLVLADPRTDLAILKIDPKGETLPVVPFRDSDTVEVGELVLAIGNPFGVGQTVTQGIVSAVARTNAGISDYQFFIQTDAAINPGNSGGALVGLDGALIGINTAIFSRTGGSIGIGFAIPANMVRATLDGAKDGGRVTRAWLGAETQGITADIAATVGLDRPRGVIVRSVYPDGPAAKAGLEVGDVILSIGGFDVDDPQSVRYRIATGAIGQTVKLEGLRKGEPRGWDVALAAPPDGDRETAAVEGRNPLTGAVVARLNPAFAEELGIEQMTGIVVLGAQRGSIAARYRFQRGDIIVSVNDARADTVDGLKRALDDADAAGGWRIVVNRGGALYTLEVQA